MDSIVEENGNSSNMDEGHNLSTTAQQQPSNLTNSANVGNSQQSPATVTATPASVLATTANVVQYLPSHGLQQMQSVIQSSVIQTVATNAQSMGLSKGGVLYVGKPNTTVIHPTPGNTVQHLPNFPYKIKHEPIIQQLDSNSEDSLSDEDSPRRLRELTRRPSYNKIYSEISGPEITGGTTLQMPDSGIPTIASTGGGTAGTLMHLSQDNPSTFYLPNNSVINEDQTRKREIRLQKNREAARECRRKKKEYIKCLENRVAVLENQNKALIEELKSLKELYCQTKND